MKLSESVKENTLEFLLGFPVYKKVLDRNENGDMVEKYERVSFEEASAPVCGTTPDNLSMASNLSM